MKSRENGIDDLICKAEIGTDIENKCMEYMDAKWKLVRYVCVRDELGCWD